MTTDENPRRPTFEVTAVIQMWDASKGLGAGHSEHRKTSQFQFQGPPLPRTGKTRTGAFTKMAADITLYACQELSSDELKNATVVLVDIKDIGEQDSLYCVDYPPEDEKKG